MVYYSNDNIFFIRDIYPTTDFIFDIAAARRYPYPA